MVLNPKFVAFCRTIHVYLSVLGLAVILFYGVTGFMANHEEWFGATEAPPRLLTGQTPLELIQKNDRLGVVEHLRKTWSITGAMTSFDVSDDSLSIGFKEPGRLWDIEVATATGKTTVNAKIYNFAAIITDLHRGRYAGPTWRWVTDISAILIVVACFTGLVLWLVLPKRRKIGTAALVLGIVLTYAIYHRWVPGPDEKVTKEEPAAAKEN